MSMSSAPTISKPFVPGTTGWTVADLDDPATEQRWLEGRYEIVEGVLTTMPPAYFRGANALYKVMYRITRFLEERGLPGEFAPEVDLVLSETRVCVADAILLTPDDRRRQEVASGGAGGSGAERTRILIPPTLVVESVSPGHQLHDRRTKMKWYAEFGVPNYWIIDAFQKSLECFILEEEAYRPDQSGRDHQPVRPSLFPGLILPLDRIWES